LTAGVYPGGPLGIEMETFVTLIGVFVKNRKKHPPKFLVPYEKISKHHPRKISGYGPA